MKIFDCFMYFDEEIVLDVRLNTLNNFVDYFVIVESKFTHKGESRNLNFNHEKFKKFKDKIIYLVYDEEPPKVRKIKSEYSVADKSGLYILNAAYRENAQRNYIKKGLDEAHDNDLILISDVDEIPNLSKIDIKKINQKIILFKQDMFYYKFNLAIPNFKWTGTKACKKKDLVNPQWIRNVKDRKYKFFRLDTYFSNTKYTSIKIIEDGGWHFSNIKNAEQIEHKLKSYLHHREFDLKPMSKKEIEEIIKSKRAIYDLKVDQRINKIGNGNKLENFDFYRLPNYLQQNKNYFKDWID
jgi:beta-1,4-mannosyl-glycoprotein beta-1,4-N-acetylglucosaminyltransferase